MSIPNIAAITFMQNLSGSVFPIFDSIIIYFGAKGLQTSMFHLEVNKQLRCLSHAYTREMSGDVIDDKLFNHFQPFVQAEWEKVKTSTPDPRIIPDVTQKMLMRTMQNLRQTVRQIKTQTNTQSDIVGTVTLIPFDEDIEVKISQSEFESIVRRDLEVSVQRTLEAAIDKASKKFQNLNLHYVRWTGGSSLLPLFQNLVRDFFTQQGMFYFFIFFHIFLMNLISLKSFATILICLF